MIDASRRPRSWLITINAPLYVARKRISHVFASTSRWFVGSSSSSRSRPAEQDLRKLEATPLPARQALHGQLETVLRQAEAGHDRLGLRFGLIAAEQRVLLLQT